jgi:hypothetical protein
MPLGPGVIRPTRVLLTPLKVTGALATPGSRRSRGGGFQNGTLQTSQLMLRHLSLHIC